ncbi:MAG: hypothetical protein ACFFG0_01460 [Candidatus Thorarchaeota archaeon]
MVHPSSLLSYYPTYAILDEIVSYGNYKKLTIFMDLKNNLQTTYMKHAIINIVENSKKSRYKDSSIFSSLISFLSFHKIYGIKRGIDIDFIIFFETGQSYYHKNISKKYKISRKIDDLYGLKREDRELFYEVLHSNYGLIDKACNKFPGVKVIRTPNLEADFIPYYLISRNKIPSENRGFIIYSNDHDLMQCVSKNSFIYSKSAKTKKIIKPGMVMDSFLKRKNNIEDKYLPLAMSVIGDTGDDVDGVQNVGGSRFLDMFDELISLTGDMGEIYKKVENNLPLIDPIPQNFKNKYLKTVVDSEISRKLISNNLKLVSFEVISRALENPNSVSMIEKRELIQKILDINEEVPAKSMKDALEGIGVFLTDASIDLLYI